LLCEPRPFGFGPYMGVGSGAVRLSERVPASDQCEGLFVVHAHPAKGLTDIVSRGDRVGDTVGPLRVDVDQTHLHGGQRFGQLTVAAVALVTEPDLLRTPVDVVFGCPDV